jgi:hypothetical protein
LENYERVLCYTPIILTDFMEQREALLGKLMAAEIIK